MIQVSATEYKHNALKLLEQVRLSGEAIQITKRGRPVAQLIPIPSSASKRVLGMFAGEVAIRGDIVGPIVDPNEWDDLA